MTGLARSSARRLLSPRLSPEDAAWLGLVPATVLLLAALLWLAPPLSDLIFLSEPEIDFFAFPRTLVRPEHVEATRFLLAVIAAFLLAGWVIRVAGRDADARGTTAVIAVQVAGLVFIAVCAFEQRDATSYLGESGRDPSIFSEWNWLTAVAIAAALVAGALGAGRDRLAAVAGKLRPIVDRRSLALGVAIALTGLWLLPAVYSEATVGHSEVGVLYHLPVYFDEYVAFLNGRTPLVDFIPEFTHLLPYAAAPALAIFGHSLTSYTILMTTLTAFALLAIYGTLAAATGRRDLALALYVLVLAVALIPYAESGIERTFGANLYAIFPDRYLGPLVVGWLCALHLRYSQPRPWMIFAVAGLATLNNVEFGLASLVAAFVALWIGFETDARVWPRTRVLLGRAAAGLGLALALVSLATLARADSLPDLGLLVYFAKVHGQAGYGLLRMPALGLHLVVYLTFVAALLTATVRMMSGARERALTGALGYSGSLGLLAGVYYAGSSEIARMMALFPVWGLAVALLAVIALRSLDAARVNRAARRRAMLPALAVSVALGLMTSTISEFPLPWQQLERLSSSAPNPYDTSAVEAFISARTSPGETVSILNTHGHRLAEDAGVENASPFNDPVVSILSAQEMDRVLNSLADAGGRKLYTGKAVYPEIPQYLADHGFVAVAKDPGAGVTEWQPASRP